MLNYSGEMLAALGQSGFTLGNCVELLLLCIANSTLHPEQAEDVACSQCRSEMTSAC